MKDSQRIIRCFDDSESVSAAAADCFLEAAGAAIAERGRFSVALSGGSTPRRVFELLAAPANRGRVDWGKIEFFWGDERSVPREHADSNYRMALTAMLEPLSISAEKIHRMPAERKDLEQAASEYGDEIRSVIDADGGIKDLPRLDLVMLGMGTDGHTASLFPYTTALAETTRLVVPNYVEKLDTWRMTMTALLINQARHILFLVAGADKAIVLSEVLEGPEDSKRLPSQMIKPVQGELVWLVDAAAAARLEHRPSA
ncbi:MAG: 6-phosphogluconolactonase [Pseudomonadota bacterium]